MWEVHHLGTAVRSVEHLQMVGSVTIFILHSRGGFMPTFLNPSRPPYGASMSQQLPINILTREQSA